MRLKINGEQVSYTLEEERTLQEVVRGVRGWLGDAGFVVTGLRAGSRELPEAQQPAWGVTPIASVEELDVRAMHAGDARIAHWETLHSWLGMLGEGVRPPWPGLGELLASLPEALEGMKANPFLPPGSTEAAALASALSGQSEEEVRGWAPPRAEDALRAIERLRDALGRRISAASRPRESLGRCLSALRGSLGLLPGVSLLLQTGRDRQAMAAVVDFADGVQALLALLPFLPPDPRRDALFGELTAALRDLVAAFDAKDSVLIGDLLEYEVSPRLEKILPLLEEIA